MFEHFQTADIAAIACDRKPAVPTDLGNNIMTLQNAKHSDRNNLLTLLYICTQKCEEARPCKWPRYGLHAAVSIIPAAASSVTKTSNCKAETSASITQ